MELVGKKFRLPYTMYTIEESKNPEKYKITWMTTDGDELYDESHEYLKSDVEEHIAKGNWILENE